MSKVAGEGNYVIKGEQGLNKINFYPISMSSEKMAGFLAHEKEKSAHYVPSDAKFIKLSGQDNKLKALRDFEAKIRVEGLNGFKKHAFFITDEKLEKTAQKVGENEYLLSDEDLFFGTSEKFTEIEKNASANFSNHEVERDASGLFNLRGPEFAKYAQEAPIRNLNLHDTQ